MPDRPNGRRELALEDAARLDGLWVATGLADAPGLPLSELAWELVTGDVALVGDAVARRGAPLPRRARKTISVEGYAYHALLPLVRAARELLPIDGRLLSITLASEALTEIARTPARPRVLSRRKIARLVTRMTRRLGALERRVLDHERDASQHYRWLVEMDLGILPDDALKTTIGECVAVQRVSRELEIEATLELVAGYAALVALAARARLHAPETFAFGAALPDVLELPSATPALALWSSLRASAARGEPTRAAALAAFIADFGERGPRQREPRLPRWAESPEWVTRLAELLESEGARDGEVRLIEARRRREIELAAALRSASFMDARVLHGLLKTLRRTMILRSRLHVVRARTLSMLRTAALDADRRLCRLWNAERGTAFFLQLSELMESTWRPDPRHAALAHARYAAWQASSRGAPPPVLLGGAVHPQAANARRFMGVGVGSGAAEGRVTVARDFDDALTLTAGDILVVRSFDAGWAPLLLAVRAVISDAGGITDEAVVAASALGVPVLLGTRTAAHVLKTGDRVRLDLDAGFAERVDHE